MNMQNYFGGNLEALYPNLYPNSKINNGQIVDKGLRISKKVVPMVDKRFEIPYKMGTELLLSRGSGVRIHPVAPFEFNLKVLYGKALVFFM